MKRTKMSGSEFIEWERRWRVESFFFIQSKGRGIGNDEKTNDCEHHRHDDEERLMIRENSWGWWPNMCYSEMWVVVSMIWIDSSILYPFFSSFFLFSSLGPEQEWNEARNHSLMNLMTKRWYWWWDEEKETRKGSFLLVGEASLVLVIMYHDPKDCHHYCCCCHSHHYCCCYHFYQCRY